LSVCRHCGKPLPFLQKFSGGEEFCSKAHRQSYHDEYDRLALGRLVTAGTPEVRADTATAVLEQAPPETPPAPGLVAGAVIVPICADGEPLSAMASAMPSDLLLPSVPLFEDLAAKREGPCCTARIESADRLRPRSAAAPVPAAARFEWPLILEDPLLFGLRPVYLDLGIVDHAPVAVNQPVETPTPVRIVKAGPPPQTVPQLAAGPAKAGFAAMTIAPAKPSQDTFIVCSEPLRCLPKGIFVPRFEVLPLRARICFAPKPAEIAPLEEPAAEPVPVEAAPEVSNVSGFEFTSAKEGFWTRLPLAAKALVVVSLLAAGGVSAWRLTMQPADAKSDSQSSAAQVTARSVSMGPGGWFTREADDKEGQQAGRTFSLYRPSLDLSDYRMEFLGRIERRGLGWVVRLKDTSNYYAMKLEREEGKLKLVRWAVIGGKESSRSEVSVPPMGGVDKGYSVRVDVRGARITTALQGQQIDTWTDNRLAAGGFGFSNDAEERARIDSVKFFLIGK
jgi:hypothetical protein